MKKFKNYTKDVQNTKSGFTSPMWWILKYIKDEENYINQDFFAWKEFVTQVDIDILLKSFDEKLDYIKSFKKKVIGSDLSQIEKKFLLNTLNSIWLKYILFKYSIYLEAEKAWFEINEGERKLYLSKINKLQDIIYWPEISKNPNEKEEVLNELSFIYSENKTKITHFEELLYLEYLYELWFNRDKNFVNNIKKTKSKNNLSNIYLSNEKIDLLFKMVLDIYWLNNRSVFLDPLVWNFSVKREKKQIILPVKNLKTYSLERLLKLFDHEIWVHVIRWENSSNTIKTSWEWYIEWEEWFATLTEELLEKELNYILTKPTEHHITTFFAENFDWVNTKKFLEIYYKLIKPFGTPLESIFELATDRMLRVKRFVSLNEKWANRKDVSYTRWQKQIVEFFQNNDNETNWQFLKDFYFAKLSFEDIWLVNELKESLWIDEKELKYPLWIGKILYKKLSWNKVFLSSLKEEDFRFQVIENLSIDIKRKVVKILQEVRWKKK